MRSTALALLILSSSFASAQVAYTVRARNGMDKLEVTMSFRARKGSNAVEIPRWAPGAYNLMDTKQRVRGLKVTTSREVVASTQTKDHRYEFTVPRDGPVTLTYDVPNDKVNDRLHFSGPSTYLYVDGRKTERCTLNLDIPEGWRAWCGLDETQGDRAYVAPDYDVLADNPVSAGKLVSADYKVRAVPHQIVVHSGPVEKLDMAELTRICTFISRAEGDFWSGFPFKKFVWHVSTWEARDGGWGLEHLSSTQVGVSSGMGMGLRSVLAHEYFHAWNVKRIRSKSLGPFDYTKLPKTGALWWLEGVTDYYASLVLARYGMGGLDYLGEQVGRNFSAYKGNAAHTEVSPHDSSFRVGEANNGRGNSSGFKISYYTLGWLVGFCLDVELRDKTAGRVSLDDVTKQLYAETNGKPGFEEGRIREILVEKGGASLGTAYDDWVMKAGSLPVETQLNKVGLTMTQVDEPTYSFGLDVNATEAKTGLEIRTVLEPASGVLQPGDLITSVGGVSTVGSSTGQGARNLERAANEKNLPSTDRKVAFEVVRAGQKLTLQVPTRVTMRKATRVVELPLVAPDQRLRRAALVYGRAPTLAG